MATISLRLPDDLKLKTSAAAASLGLSPQAFMIDAIRQAIDAVEQQKRVIAQAQVAGTGMMTSGKEYDFDEVHAYLRARLD
jgi:predicted transcriptional regulator